MTSVLRFAHAGKNFGKFRVQTCWASVVYAFAAPKRAKTQQVLEVLERRQTQKLSNLEKMTTLLKSRYARPPTFKRDSSDDEAPNPFDYVPLSQSWKCKKRKSSMYIEGYSEKFKKVPVVLTS